MIVIINGCSSAGKSSIIKEMQKLSKKPLLHTGIDWFWKMIPGEYKEFGSKAHEGYSFTQTVESQNNPVIHVQTGQFGQKIDNAMPYVIKCLADFGHDIAIDEIFTRDTTLHNYITALRENTVYFVGVMCSLQELEKREKQRGNRELGLARGQIDFVHEYCDYYDFIVDSTDCDATVCAQHILNFIDANPYPSGMRKLEPRVLEKSK
ncbi:MAG TPA: hypothetical protein VJJ26_01530 [Candidatus Babeliales bacterium]|nr:hypothetical protein [Candidatus Babeliales bacterium]